ncbi:hypothetical protein ACMAZD_26175 (plasmid) [Vibrio sp. nBUS_14]|uniref:hypothetical protein n=1 Tax=Vibrio sp. nBUS_14 TaxID=3395321 RepID=UPI003EB8F960
MFGKFFGGSSSKNTNAGLVSDKNKKDGSIDHRGNSGNDRTPSQKEGDKKRRKE